MSEFDKKAADWDNNHDHFNRAVKLANYLQEYVPLKQPWNMVVVQAC